MNAEDFQARASSAGREATNFQEKTFLVVDDIVSMRSSLRNTISTLGGTRIDMAGNGREAINRLEQRAYDVILCNHDLVGGKNGQQLLEEAKRRKLVKNSTIFMMVTAERSYEKVVSAAELASDDYLIKPIAGEVLRLEHLAQKKTYFSPGFCRERQCSRGAICLSEQKRIKWRSRKKAIDADPISSASRPSPLRWASWP